MGRGFATQARDRVELLGQWNSMYREARVAKPIYSRVVYGEESIPGERQLYIYIHVYKHI